MQNACARVGIIFGSAVAVGASVCWAVGVSVDYVQELC
jgi:hypothetical protein